MLYPAARHIVAGGAAPLATRARTTLNKGKPLDALHLLDIALTVEPKHTMHST